VRISAPGNGARRLTGPTRGCWPRRSVRLAATATKVKAAGDAMRGAPRPRRGTGRVRPVGGLARSPPTSSAARVRGGPGRRLGGPVSLTTLAKPAPTPDSEPPREHRHGSHDETHLLNLSCQGIKTETPGTGSNSSRQRQQQASRTQRRPTIVSASVSTVMPTGQQQPSNTVLPRASAECRCHGAAYRKTGFGRPLRARVMRARS
jgi:hypothetical protein